MEPLVLFDNVGVSLGGRPVLREVDLVVERGESVGITGPNGSGKTTLIRSAATLLAIDEGTAHILGRDTREPGASDVRSSIGLIGHRPALISELTLHENLEHIARLSGIDPSRIERALDVVGLAAAADRRAEASSFGMQRRVEIAHLLMTRPNLLLLDEAASGLDDSARDLIAALVSSVTERGGGCIVVSHDASQLIALTSRVLSLSSGRLGIR